VARSALFTMRLSDEERELIARLVRQEQRSASVLLRQLVRQALKDQEEHALAAKPGALVASRT
jgi:hypothetical protein